MNCDEIVFRKISDLTLLENNPRKISKKDLDRLVDSIRLNGFWLHRPLPLSDRTGKLVVLGGHQRIKAAKKLKLTEVPTILYHDLTEEQEADIVLRDNINNGEWDPVLLNEDWKDKVDFSFIGLAIPDFGEDDDKSKKKAKAEEPEEDDTVGEDDEDPVEDKEDFFVDGLSRGMKQRLCLARALIHDPDLLILDEPASGLDPRTRVEYTAILKELRDQGKTLLVSSHILSELSELCTSIGIIEQGRTVLQGSMDQIFARINSSNPLLISIFSQKEKALAILKSHPCVQTIAVQGDEIKLGFLGDRQDEALLLQQLIDADVMVSSFMREKGSLESLFMQITGHEEERAVLKHEMESGI